MQHASSKPDFLYQALKVYLILGRQGPLDRDLVEQWMGADFAATSRARTGAERARRSCSMWRRCWNSRCSRSALNGPLVAQVRGILTRSRSPNTATTG